jgi:hypothetical protein
LFGCRQSLRSVGFQLCDAASLATNQPQENRSHRKPDQRDEDGHTDDEHQQRDADSEECPTFGELTKATEHWLTI